MLKILNNGKLDGFVKIYYESGALNIEVNYKNGKAVSAKCANGRTLNNEELSNWKNGFKAICD